MNTPFIVGIGGTTSTRSSTERALETSLAAASAGGARVQIFGGAALCALPHYTMVQDLTPAGRALVDAVRAADGLIVASPGYHGSVSGLVKNALDFLQETARDERPYLDGLPVGLIVTAHGWQATGSTLAALRSIVHALRGWPTPLGATIKANPGLFENDRCTDAIVADQLATIGQQVLEFARLRQRVPQATVTADEQSSA